MITDAVVVLQETKNQDNVAQFRLFNRFFPASGSKPLENPGSITLKTFTTTEFTTSTLTATVASIVSCIPTSLFITETDSITAILTALCARKRRASDEVAAQLEEDRLADEQAAKDMLEGGAGSFEGDLARD